MGITAGAAAGQSRRPGPAEPVGAAALVRTSTLDLQDPVASYRRQIRSIQAWLPAGWYIAAVYADVESGGIDIEQRSQTRSWQVLTDAGLQRDGGIADMLTEAASPEPRFAVAVCEDIERSARDTYNSLKIEKELSRNGVPIFATDEPADIEGVNPTTILVRRVKQGVAEWFRLQLRNKTWKGLQEHSLEGWNIGAVPYGYAAERHPHPNPVKASQGRTKTRLAVNPDTGPWVTRIYQWRVLDKMALSGITRRLQELGAPAPNGKPWSIHAVDAILRNPKYTGYMVFGRRRTDPAPGSGKKIKMPPDQWLWTPEPVHPALIDMQAWKDAQAISHTSGRGRTRDRQTPTRRDGGAPLRGRIRCDQCERRLSAAPRAYKDHVNLYYVCPHNPNDPRQAARYPGHVRASLKDTTITKAIAGVLDDYVFGHDRAAMLTAQLPATAADKQADRDKQAAALRRKIAQIDASENALMTELEELGTDTTPAATAYRKRIRDRFTQRQAEREDAQQQLDTIQTQTLTADDPALLDTLPYAAGKFTTAPAPVREALYQALDIQCLYRQNKQQVTIWVTITDATPDTIQALLDDPRTDSDTGTGTPTSTNHTTTTSENSANPLGTRMACPNTHLGTRGGG